MNYNTTALPVNSTPVDFRKAFRKECIEGSAIAPELFEASIEFIEDTGRYETYEALGLTPRTQWQIHKPHNFGVVACFMNEDATLWHSKPENPMIGRDGKPQRYQAKKGGGAGFYKPPVPIKFRRKIAERQGIEVPETGLFWDWVSVTPGLTLVHTEGGKKGQHLLSNGYIAIAHYGATSGYSVKNAEGNPTPPRLVDDVAAICHPSTTHIIAFDQDTKDKARHRVNVAISRYGKLIEATGGKVCIAEWGGHQGKGIDDLGANMGVAAVDTAIANAISFEAWTKKLHLLQKAELARKMLSCSYEPTVRVNQRYLNPTVLPTLKPGEILAISSAVGTGKTEVLKSVVATHKANHPDSWVFFIGYRNSLLLQTGQRLGLPHIQELEREYPGHISFALGERKAALLCLDSIFKIPWNLLPPNSLLIFDEAEATANHGLGGGTLGDRQNEALPLLEAICKQNLGNGGNLVLAEDSLTDIGLNFYKELTGSVYPIHLVQNDWKPQRTATLSNSDESGFCEKIQTELNAGKKIALLTDSQTFGEKVEHFFVGVKSFRLDSKTAETLDAKAFQSDPNGYLKEHQPNLVTLSPTAESGVSIDLAGYHVRANLTSGDTRRQFQLLNRVRNPESIDILTKDRGILSDNDWKTDPRHLIRQWAISMRHTAILSQVEADLQAQDWSPEAQASLVTLEATLQGSDKSSLFWTRHYANFKARENVLKQGMGLNLEGYLCDRGFTVERVEYPTNKAVRNQLKRGKEAIESNTATKLYQAAGGQAESVALSILSSGSATYEQRINAQKSLLQKRLPGADLSEEFLLKAIVQKRGKGFKDTQTLWTCQHPEIAKKLDRSQIKGQLVKGLVFPWKLSHHAQKADLFRQLGLQAFVDLANSGIEFKDGDAIVQIFREKALNNSAACWRVFQLNFNSGQSGIHMLSRMVKRLGLKLKSPRRVGGKGKQERVRLVVSAFPSEYRAEIFNALNRKWADDLNSVVTISNKEIPYIEMVTTEPDPPPKEGAWGVGDVVLFALDGSECKIQRVEGDRFRVKRVGAWESTVSFDVSAGELRAIA